MLTPAPLTPEARAELRKLAEAATRNRLHIDVYTEAATPEAVLALLDALEAAQKDLADAAGELPVPVPEPGTTAAKLLSANVLLRRENAALRKEIACQDKLNGEVIRAITAECERLKAEVAEVVGLLRETARRIRNLAEFYPDVEGLPEGDPDAVDMAWQVLASSLTSADAFLAKHQRPAPPEACRVCGFQGELQQDADGLICEVCGGGLQHQRPPEGGV